MDLGDLQIFRAVAREGGVTRAAERLHRVQSNVTTRLRQLEDGLGTELFVREGRRMRLNDAGQVLLGYADRLLELADEARDALGDGKPRGRLRLGSMESTAAARLPRLLAAFHMGHPEVQLELRTGATARMLAELVEGRVDCALVCGPVNDERLVGMPVFSENMLLIAPPGQPPIHSALDLERRCLLGFEPGCSYRVRLENWLATEGVVPERFVELASYHAMIGCVAAGMGVAIVPESLLATIAGGEAVSRHELPQGLRRATTMFVRRSGALSPAVAALGEALREAGDFAATEQAAA